MKGKTILALLAVAVLVTACKSQKVAPKLEYEPVKENEQQVPEKSAEEIETDTAQYHSLTQEETLAMMGEEENFILLDVRTQEEHAVSRIANSLLIPDFELEEKAEEMLPDKTQLIFVYCRSGKRSETAARILVEMGYTNIYDIGGIIDWPYGIIEG